MKMHLINRLIKIAGVTAIALMMPLATYAKSPIWAPEPLAHIIEEGLANNQSIKSLESQIDALKEQVPLAGSLPDPRLGIALINLPVDSLRFDEEPMTQKQISIAQKFPWFGKRGLQSDQAAFAVRQKEMVLNAERLSLSKEIANAYYELGFIAESQDINTRLTQMLQRILRAAESRYATGKGLQQNIFQAQVELSKLTEKSITLRKNHRVAEDRLNELLNREHFESIIPPVNLPSPYFTLSIPELKNFVLKNNPRLKAKKYEILQAQTGIELARKDYWPDMDVKVSYGQREENRAGQDWVDFFSTGITMNIPLWQKTRQDKKLAAVTASHRSKKQLYNNLEDSLNHQVDAAATEILDLQENFLLYNDALIPQTKQWARAALDAYEVGKVEFDTMIKAQTQLLKFELQAQRYLFNIYQKRADLEEMIGQHLTEEQGD
ncbi:MAG: TolC family protein [Desulfobacteraceae bacterium]|nr:TolC family protein [Desulfobacteraceae bacterium]MBC2754705.1 TolC family protein [Desulfobacteraceae bacterium]